MFRTATFAVALLAGSACAQTITTQQVASGLDRPIFVTGVPGDSSRLYVIEQEGAIRIIKDGALLATPFLDIDPLVTGGTSGGDERGLLGLAFAPDYETSGKFYVNYTGTDAGQLTTYIVEYQRDAMNPDLADPNSARPILSFEQPNSNHNGGWLGFGPNDGYLYISTGDGGSGNDPDDNASDLLELLGKILRIDVSDDSVPYTVPTSNPYAMTDNAQPEIWAYGLRNPWRTSFDRETGDLWIGDVGQGAREEVNFQPASSPGGEHYGWRCREGTIQTPGLANQCPDTNPLWVDPVYDYSRSGGNCSVVGGYVYRGCALGDDFAGKYIFGDYCSARVWMLDPDNGFSVVLLADVGGGLASFGEGPDGELYVTNLGAGTISRIANPAIGDVDGDGIPDPCDCIPDITNDGYVNNADINAFVSAFLGEDPIGDINGDGSYNNTDINLFVTAFLAGCED